ncbi:hypothetical protein C8J38_10718 [Rhizobium sp. PP-WC-2G-219]|nr:hypothetical protein C8J38_10718 [Rhizobium sp. PP-WC-2G-219]
MAAATILIVAFDRVFRRSLEFALEVEGFLTESHERLSDADGSLAAAVAVCAVVDEDVLHLEDGALQSLARMSTPVIFLADSILAPTEGAGVIVLTKPLHGSDLLDAVRRFSVIGQELE